MSTPGWAQGKLTLDTALDYAIERNRNLVRTALSMKSSQFGIDAADAEFSIRVAPDGDLEVSDDRDIRRYGIKGSKRFMLGTEVELRGGVSTLR